nr:hypothetical protein HK105_004634 [Polyrhizophydium stewartii]
MAECPVERIVFDVSCLSHVYDLELLVEMGDDDHKLVCHFYLPLAYEEFFSDTDDQEPAGKAILHVALTANAITNKIEATSRELLTPPRLLPDSTIRLPALGLDTLILDYVEQVQDVLARSRNARFNSLASREMLVKCFLTEFQQFIVEYDSVDFTYLSLFISIVSPVPNKSTPNVTAAALVNITIPKSFPDAPPAIMLVSPVVFKSPDSHVPESREWRVAFTRNTIIEDYVEFVK